MGPLMSVSSLYILVALYSGIAALSVMMFAMLYVIIDRTATLRKVDTRLEVLENYMAQMVAEIFGGEMMGMTSGGEAGEGTFRSLDGKFTASTMEELIKKMSEEPDTDPHTEEMKLRDFFTDATKDEKGEWHDSDDDEDDDKPWLRK